MEWCEVVKDAGVAKEDDVLMHFMEYALKRCLFLN